MTESSILASARQRSLGSDGVERLTMSQLVEALLVRGLAGRLTPKTIEAIRQIGIDLDRPLLPAYPTMMFADAVAVLASTQFPEVPVTDAYRLLGERTVYGLDETTVGRAQMALARLVGPMRTMKRVPRNMRSGGSHSTAVVTQTSARGVLFEVAEYWLPYAEFMQGALHATLVITGAKGSAVSILRFDANAHTAAYQADWAG